MDGPMMLPPVSLPMAKPTNPAAVAAPGPALDPDDPSSSSHGFIVWPPNQMSFSASAPMLSLATSTAPASCRRFTTAASWVGTRSLNGSAPYMVGMPAVSTRSLAPRGMPCSGPRYLPDLISLSACPHAQLGDQHCACVVQTLHHRSVLGGHAALKGLGALGGWDPRGIHEVLGPQRPSW